MQVRLHGFSMRGALLEAAVLEATVRRIDIEKLNCGCSLSKRIRRLRRNASAYYVAGNPTRLLRSRPASVSALSGHQRACAEVCVVCFERIIWIKGVYHLPDDSSTLATLMELLELSIAAEICAGETYPSSCHYNCLNNLKIRPAARNALAAKLDAFIKAVSAAPVSSRLKRHSAASAHQCRICCMYATKVQPPRRKRKAGVLESKEVDAPAAAEKIASATTATAYVLSKEAFSNAACAVGMSANMALNFAAALEFATANEGKPMRVEPGAKDAMYARNKLFAPYIKQVSLNCKEGAAAIVHDWDGFYKTICGVEKVRAGDLQYSTWSMDHGGTSLKVTMSFVWKTSEESASKLVSPARLKALKLSGVRKLYAVALVTGVKETYEVVQALLASLQLAKMKNILREYGAEIGLVNDQKMSWLLHGKSHGGTHPCNYCPWMVRDGLGNETVLRTPADDERDHKQWQHVTSDFPQHKALQMVKQFNNCIRPSLISDLYDTPDDYLINLSRPMPLHLKLRNGNHIIGQLHKASPQVYDALLRSAGCVVEPYHQELEGGPMSRVLTAARDLPALIEADTRRLVEEEDDVRPLSELRKGRVGVLQRADDLRRHKSAHPAVPLVEMFAALDELLQLVSRREYDPAMDSAARRYRRALSAAGCKPTVMMHILVDEVPRFCKRNNCGLGFHSEQAAESMHYEERKFEERWHVPLVGTSGHGAGLVLSMCGMNSAHCWSL